MTAQSATAPAVEPGSACATASHSKTSVALFCGVFGLLLAGPLAFGETEPWSVFMLEAGSSALLILWLVRQLVSGEIRMETSSLFSSQFAFATLIAVELATGWTANRDRTFNSALLFGAYAMLCFLALQLLHHRWQLRALATAVSIYGFALASFAIIQSITSNGRIYWIRAVPSNSGTYGPYVNHNHYAGLMEMLVPVPLLVALSRHVRDSNRLMAALAAAVMASTIFLCGSRAGMVVLVAQIGLLTGFLFWWRQYAKAGLMLAVFAVSVTGLLIWLGGSQVEERITSIHDAARQELSGGTRLAIDRDCWKMFRERPALGWGLGVFPDIYPQFRSFYSEFTVDRAHNDYLQLLVETGMAGAAVALWFLAIVFRSAFRKLREASDTNRSVALAALLGVSGLLIHSLFDFNLQIPANASMFFVLCGIAAMEHRFGSTRRRHSSTEALKINDRPACPGMAARD